MSTAFFHRIREQPPFPIRLLRSKRAACAAVEARSIHLRRRQVLAVLLARPNQFNQLSAAQTLPISHQGLIIALVRNTDQLIIPCPLSTSTTTSDKPCAHKTCSHSGYAVLTFAHSALYPWLHTLAERNYSQADVLVEQSEAALKRQQRKRPWSLQCLSNGAATLA